MHVEYSRRLQSEPVLSDVILRTGEALDVNPIDG